MDAQQAVSTLLNITAWGLAGYIIYKAVGFGLTSKQPEKATGNFIGFSDDMSVLRNPALYAQQVAHDSAELHVVGSDEGMFYVAEVKQD